MILGDPDAPHIQTAGRSTLDDLFRTAAARRPDAIALCDPLNRRTFTDGEPRRLTYAQADHAITAIAGRLRRLGLAPDALVALQLPNTVESVLAFLGVLRAGLIAVPLPLLWRRADAAAALNRVGAKAIITTSRIGTADHCGIAMNVAAEVFPIRYVCSFGEGLLDGVIPLNDLMTAAPLLEAALPVVRGEHGAAHVAAVTFEVTSGGLVAVGRSHAELIAGGRAVLLESALQDDAAILACCATGSFAGLAAGVMPWLLTGGTLSLHHSFDAAAFTEQLRLDDCETVVVPGALAPRIADAGLLAHSGLRNVIALWRAPERLAVAAPWQRPDIRMVDVRAFGETAVICGKRSASGEPADIPLGLAFASNETDDAVTMAETTVTQNGTLAIRGAMVPRHAFPPGAERTPHPYFNPDTRGFADTHHPCRADRDNAAVEVTGPPPGIVSVGGYRFRQDELHALAASLGEAVLTALPDAIAGHRLAGHAADRTLARQALDALGVNPLIDGAFLPRRKAEAA